jgi:hypothetical protein
MAKILNGYSIMILASLSKLKTFTIKMKMKKEGRNGNKKGKEDDEY